MTDRPELIIFDLDGVLVDTQDAENGALAHIGSLMGLELSYAESTALFSGKRMQECLDLLEQRAGRRQPPNAMALARARCEELIGPRFEPITGVAAALSAIPLAKCVASNSPRDIIERRVRAAGIAEHFGGRLYSAYDVRAWKPDPELFRWAARCQGVPPGRCVVVEDSVVGVDAALGADMRVLQYDPAQAGAHRPGAVPFPSMRALAGLIADPATAVRRDLSEGVRS